MILLERGSPSAETLVRRRRLALRAVAMCLVLTVGCGRSTSEEAVVEPPIVTNGDSDDSAVEAAPGELEFPAGAIPDVSTEAKPAEPGGGIEMPEGVVVPDDAGASNGTKIEYGTWEEIESIARSSGRVTVVDLWSLACEPCLKEFPGLVRLHQAMGSKVQCMAVDLDFDGRKSRPPEYYEEQVVDFLQSVEAKGFPSYISSTPSDDVFAAAKIPSIPAVLVFGADGELVKAFVDAGESAGFTYENDVVPLVTKLAG